MVMPGNELKMRFWEWFCGLESRYDLWLYEQGYDAYVSEGDSLNIAWCLWGNCCDDVCNSSIRPLKRTLKIVNLHLAYQKRKDKNHCCEVFWKDTFCDAFSGTSFCAFDFFGLSFQQTSLPAKD